MYDFKPPSSYVNLDLFEICVALILYMDVHLQVRMDLCLQSHLFESRSGLWFLMKWHFDKLSCTDFQTLHILVLNCSEVINQANHNAKIVHVFVWISS